MEFIYEDETLAVTIVKAIHTGDIPSLKRLLVENPGLARTRIIGRDNSNEGDSCRMSRTLLNVVTDWPGHFPNGSLPWEC
jgi:hypothetical protein